MTATATKPTTDAAQGKTFIFDFDSTFTKVEALDVLGEISLGAHSQRDERLRKISEITNRGMEGTCSFADSLRERIDLLEAHKDHLGELVARLAEQVSDSIGRNRAFFETFSDQILVVSSGFKEFIVPIVTEYGIKEENVYANTFFYDREGKIVGYDKENPLSHDGGKVELLKQLGLKGDVYVIGDGYTDYEIRGAGLANKFYAFTENVARESVIAKADHILPNFEEFLFTNKLPMALSYPKNRIKVLLLEGVHPDAVKMFEEEGFSVEAHAGAMDEDELAEKIKGVSILGIRSKTNVTAKVLENANRLMAIGAFCIGTNQIDLRVALQKGVAVFNAPYSNTRSVAELAIGEIVMLLRGIPDKSERMHRREWFKSAKSSYEVRRKTLGIVGYGNIGVQLSVLAEAMGMNVCFYDIVDKMPVGTAKKCRSMGELLEMSDVVSLHVDGRPANKNFFGQAEFDRMKKGSYFLNLARGHVVEIEALVAALKSGHLLGAGVDVFPKEPKANDEPFESELSGLNNVILTPHIGGSTAEAQEHIGHFVPGKLMGYINTGSTDTSVNFPNLQLPTLKNAHRLIHIHQNRPGILAKLNEAMARHGCNILGQYLKTEESIGYTILDVDTDYPKELLEELRGIEGTVKFRVLY